MLGNNDQADAQLRGPKKKGQCTYGQRQKQNSKKPHSTAQAKKGQKGDKDSEFAVKKTRDCPRLST